MKTVVELPTAPARYVEPLATIDTALARQVKLLYKAGFDVRGIARAIYGPQSKADLVEALQRIAAILNGQIPTTTTKAVDKLEERYGKFTTTCK